MENKGKTFLVSAADFAFYVKGVLACSGTTNLNSSIDVSVQEQKVNGGKGNKLAYSFKYGRELALTLEAADWDLRFIAASAGTPIVEGLSDVYHIEECVNIANGIGTVSDLPVGDVSVKLNNDEIITVTPAGNTIDLTAHGVTDGKVKATYKYSTMAKTVTIDADSTPLVGELVLDADKHSSKLGRIGSVQIIVPSYQLSGNFTISLTPDGVTSTNLDGNALAVEGDTCADGSAVYAYIKEFDSIASATYVNDIAATPASVNLSVGESASIAVLGLKGAMYAPILLDNGACTFTSDDTTVATVEAKTGSITAVASGSTLVHVVHDKFEDIVQVTVA